MRIITVINSVSNDIKEVNLGNSRTKKREGSEAESSFGDMVNYLKNSSGEEYFKTLERKKDIPVELSGSSLAGDLSEDESQDSNVDNSYIGDLVNALDYFLVRKIIGSEYENGKESIPETIFQEVSKLHSLMKNGDYEIEELLAQLEETSHNEGFMELIKKLTSSDEVETLSDYPTGDILSSYTEEKKNISINSSEISGILNKVLKSTDKQQGLEGQWNKETFMSNQKYSRDEELSFTTSEIKTLSDMGEEKSTSKDVTFLKSLLLEKDNAKGNYYGVIQRAPIESNYSSLIESPVINGKTLQEDLIKVINYASKGNIQEISVKINPEELGSIIVRLTLEDNSLKAKVRVSSEETYKLLINSIGELNNTLKAGEIKIQEVEISLFSEEGFYYSEESRSNDYGGNDRNTNKHSSFANDSLSKRDEEVINPSDILIEGTINSLV